MTNKVTCEMLSQNLEEFKNNPRAIYLKGYIKDAKIGVSSKKKSYLNFTFGDDSGTVSGKIWEEPLALDIMSQLDKSGKKSAVVEIETQVGEWQNAPDLKVKTMKLNFQEPVFQFLEKAKSDPKVLFEKVKELVDRVTNPNYKKLLEAIFLNVLPEESEELKAKLIKLRKDFLAAGAATGHHHNYIHGLLEHSYNVTDTAMFFAKKYEDIHDIDYDLIITGGLLHDLGKVREYEYEEGIQYSSEGPYVYHTVSGAILIYELNRELGINMDVEELNRLLHIISSHHGEYAEHGPNQECTEAHIMAFADMADSQVNKTFRAFANGTARKMRSRFN